MNKFYKRSEEKEFLDDFFCEGEDLKQNLRELKLINKWLGGNNVTFNGLKKSLQGTSLKNKITIADLGCGGGDILLLIAEWAKKKNIRVELTGIDANSFIIAYAKNNTKKFQEIRYEETNVFSKEFSQRTFDIINCTLFCHHLDDESLVKLLSQLKNQIQISVVINDLHRHPFAYYSIKWLTYFFSKSYMVKNDAAISVLRGFKKNEWKNIIQKAGFVNYSIRWRWAFRWEIILRN